MHLRLDYSAISSAFEGCLGNNFSLDRDCLFYSIAQVHQFVLFGSHCATPQFIIANVLQNVLQLIIVISVISLLNKSQQCMVSRFRGSFVYTFCKPRDLSCIRLGTMRVLASLSSCRSLKVFVNKTCFKTTKIPRV